jgi:hypothetical protein
MKRTKSPPKRSAVSADASEKKPLIANPHFKENSVCEFITWLNDFMCYNIPPGPKLLPMHFIVNINKGTMMIYLFSLMCYFNNFSTGAWVYLALHGNYGICWWVKDVVFPDAGFGGYSTFFSLMLPWPIALIPYYYIGYWMMSGTDNRDPSPERIFCATQLYIFGVIFMLLTDGQKYLVLRERRGLITHCMNGWSRNLNYLGEMMLYGSFGVMCQRWEVWAIYGYMWGVVFMLRMVVKQYSLSKKAEWEEYKQRTWPILPKLYNSNLFSIVFYSLFFGLIYFCIQNGGMEATAKMLLQK